MSVRRILSIPVSAKHRGILGTSTNYVDNVRRSSVTTLITDLLDTMHAHQICIGLAAPQIGSDLRVAVVNLKSEESPDLILINPEIITASGSIDRKYESCMSLPGWRGQVERRKKLLLQWTDVEGKNHSENFDGFIARVIMHEVDHLDGIMFDAKGENFPLETTDLFDEYLTQ